ncbi:glycosyltransferase family 25 protein [Bathymodiolus septemdierum thioautotrophic gill symbiont]|uniref:Glycosyl transferase family 25 n=1 Tax=endosymbiont of Bathymodiolus septemdierum str. Myojin knoll TaxID=1303921 RepID=A0A0P0US72_9GAMM|nr:glycosyltransferase family 25 protein [Bathymodiolus septemdierum thioautotrophic gill symbiont]BAS67693.1 glycosyl transferase family 25 [endosymbiont of Bathymodiolus septemdierum str. Myojin knoll]
MNNSIPPVFIVNLKKDIEKHTHMQALCQRFNLQAEFVDAVDGRQLKESEINSVFSQENAIQNINRELTKGEIGCALSHKNIYQKMIDNNIENALILEDDVDFDDTLLDLLSRIDDFPKDWELMLLGHFGCIRIDKATEYSFWYKKKLHKKYIIRRPSEEGHGTHGYLLNNKGAKKFINILSEIALPIDHYTGDDKCTNLYIIQQPVITLNKKLASNSNLQADREKMETRHKSNSQGRFKGKLLNLVKRYLILLKLKNKVDALRLDTKIFLAKIKFLRWYF